MGEAKRRLVAPPYVETTAGQVLRKMQAQIANLPPAPMNGATLLEVSIADYAKLLIHEGVEASAFFGVSLFGLRVQQNSMLPGGTFVGRKNGKPVWSNNPILQEMFDAGLEATPTSPQPDRSA